MQNRRSLLQDKLTSTHLENRGRFRLSPRQVCTIRLGIEMEIQGGYLHHADRSEPDSPHWCRWQMRGSHLFWVQGPWILRWLDWPWRVYIWEQIHLYAGNRVGPLTKHQFSGGKGGRGLPTGHIWHCNYWSVGSSWYIGGCWDHILKSKACFSALWWSENRLSTRRGTYPGAVLVGVQGDVLAVFGKVDTVHPFTMLTILMDQDILGPHFCVPRQW